MIVAKPKPGETHLAARQRVAEEIRTLVKSHADPYRVPVLFASSPEEISEAISLLDQTRIIGHGDDWAFITGSDQDGMTHELWMVGHLSGEEGDQ